MQGHWPKVIYVAGAAGAFIALMAQVPFETAQSNLATYATAVHFDTLARALPLNIDRWATFFGLASVLLAVGMLEWTRHKSFGEMFTKPIEIPLEVRADANRERLRQPVSDSSAPKAKFYSRAEKERLGEMYTETAEFFAFHASENPGSFSRTLLDFMKAWTAEEHLHFTMQNADLDEKGLKASQESGLFYMALCDPGLLQKKEYLAYQGELTAILTDRWKIQISDIQNEINSLNNLVLVLKKAAATGDVRFVDDIVRTTRKLSTDYVNQFYQFQGWARECATRANAKRQELKE